MGVCTFTGTYCNGKIDNPGFYQCSSEIVNYPGCNNSSPSPECKKYACNTQVPQPSVCRPSDLDKEPCKSNPSTWNCDPKIVNYPGCNQYSPSAGCRTKACDVLTPLPSHCGEINYCSIGDNAETEWQCDPRLQSEGCQVALDSVSSNCWIEACNLNPRHERLYNCPVNDHCSLHPNDWQCQEGMDSVCKVEDPSYFPSCYEQACVLNPKLSFCPNSSKTQNIILIVCLILVALIIAAIIGYILYSRSTKKKAKDSKL